MRKTLWGGGIVAAFSLALAYYLVQSLAAPFEPEYALPSQGPALACPDATSPVLYLRRTLQVDRSPSLAWIDVLADSEVTLWVNGQLIDQQRRFNSTVAVVADLTPHLKAGVNVLGIATYPMSIDDTPTVWVHGGYDVGGVAYPLVEDGAWRCSQYFERSSVYWFSTEFDDHHWPLAVPEARRFRAVTSMPPMALRGVERAQWISPAGAPETGGAAMRREFELARRPRQAFLTVGARAPYRLVVNGTFIERNEPRVETGRTSEPPRRIYDILPYLRRGRNVIAFGFADSRSVPRLVAEGAILTEDREFVSLSTDSNWMARAGLPDDWWRRRLRDSDGWAPSASEPTSLEGRPWKNRAQPAQLEIPPNRRLGRWAGILALAAILAVAVEFLCRRTARVLSERSTYGLVPPQAARLALIPALVLLVVAFLASLDARLVDREIYNLLWLPLVPAVVAVQWWRLGRVLSGPRSSPLLARRLTPGQRRTLEALFLAALMLVGLGLRLHEVLDIPMRPDEVTAYRGTQGLFANGFPSLDFDTMPTSYASTSELIYLGTGLAELLFDRDQLVVRAPPVLFGMLTIPLIFAVGRLLFGRGVGLLAAFLYTLSSLAIDMSNFGRYFSQLQLLTVITVYCLYRTVEGDGPVQRRWLWATAGAFAATFLSWEGVILIAPALALAALIHRRGSLRPLLTDLQVWTAMAAVGLVLVAQQSHRVLQQTQRFWLGTGASKVSAKSMIAFPGFEAGFYVWKASWIPEALLPMLGLLAACLLIPRHRFRRSTLFLLIIFLGNSVLMSVLLPVRASRYAYHLTPFLILLFAAALVAAAEGVRRLAGRTWPREPRDWWSGYARTLGAVVLVIGAALASGLVLRPSQLEIPQGGELALRFPDHFRAAAYINQHRREGDVVLSSIPHAADYYLDRPSDYWLESTLHFEAVIDDQLVLRHRLTGTRMIFDLDQLRDLFARQQRIWFLAVPPAHDKMNDTEVSRFLRGNMDVVYESAASLVLFRGHRTRGELAQRKSDRELELARTFYLP